MGFTIVSCFLFTLCTCLFFIVYILYPVRFLIAHQNIMIFYDYRNLNNNRITTIDSDALKSLTQLTELKLIKNKIGSISKDAFDTLKRLKIL